MTRFRHMARGALHPCRTDSYYGLLIAWALTLLSGVGALKARLRKR